MLSRIALIADIQGNAVALEHVLRYIKAHNVEQIICLGDLVSGPEPRRVIALLREHEIICVRGNMDDVILNPGRYDGDDPDEHKYNQIDRWCHAQLGATDRAFLEALPMTHSVTLGSQRVLCFHGSPQDTNAAIGAATSDDTLAQLLDPAQANLFATGHLHLPLLRHFAGSIIVNPGSVGLPFGGKRPMPTHAEYAIILVEEGDLVITFHRVLYAYPVFAPRLLNSGMPHAAWYLSKWMQTA